MESEAAWRGRCLGSEAAALVGQCLGPTVRQPLWAAARAARCLEVTAHRRRWVEGLAGKCLGPTVRRHRWAAGFRLRLANSSG